MPSVIFRGAYRYRANASENWTFMTNNGHLGPLDCPQGASKLRGHNVFQRTAIPVNMQMC